jgi:hypothetical protein
VGGAAVLVGRERCVGAQQSESVGEHAAAGEAIDAHGVLGLVDFFLHVAVGSVVAAVDRFGSAFEVGDARGGLARASSCLSTNKPYSPYGCQSRRPQAQATPPS